jgi:hypothetical protein
MSERIPSVLYHYCSIESFYHIITSRSIWMCNSSQMNDAHENIWIQNYFSTIKEYFSGSKYKKLLKDSFDMFKWNSQPPFIFCLSAIPDLLSQWRAYSQDGQGVSIGFTTKVLNLRNGLPSPNVYADRTFGLARVEYEPRRQKKKIIDLCKSVKDGFDTAKPNDKVDSSLELAFTLVDWAMTFKSPGFKEEKEWRIVHTPSDSYEVPLDKLSELMFRLNTNRILTYYAYGFHNDFNSNLITEVVLGPKCKMMVHDIRQFLNKNGLMKTRITISKSSYR